MLGDIDELDRRPSANRGMTPRIFEYLFARIKAVICHVFIFYLLLLLLVVRMFGAQFSPLWEQDEESHRHEQLKYVCKCSFLEIYNEQITDLLEPSSTNLQVKIVILCFIQSCWFLLVYYLRL